MRAQNEPPETVVRINRRKAQSNSLLQGEPDPDLPDALHVSRVDEAALAAGLIFPQSRGSQLAGLAVGSQEGERSLDLCAAPGAKATQLHGEVTAVELHSGRARELEENCRLLGADNVQVVNADALSLPQELAGFDRALVDAPCSGLGVLAARPDLRWRAKPLPELQARAARRRRRPRAVRRHHRLFRLHDQHGRERGGGRRVRPRARAARRGVAAVRASEAAGVPAHAAARPPHVGLLHRAAARAVIEIPPELEWWRARSAEGAAWLDRLPQLVEECAELWELRVAEPFSGGNAALAVPVERADGTPAVLKVSFPSRRTEREGDGPGALARRGRRPAARAGLRAPRPADRALRPRHATVEPGRRRGGDAGRSGSPAPDLAAAPDAEPVLAARRVRRVVGVVPPGRLPGRGAAARTVAARTRRWRRSSSCPRRRESTSPCTGTSTGGNVLRLAQREGGSRSTRAARRRARVRHRLADSRPSPAPDGARR